MLRAGDFRTIEENWRSVYVTERVWGRAQDTSRQGLGMALIASAAVSQRPVCKPMAS